MSGVIPNGPRIRAARTRRGWTQADFAIRSECSARTVAAAEAGARVPAPTLRRMATALGVDAAHLLVAGQPADVALGVAHPFAGPVPAEGDAGTGSGTVYLEISGRRRAAGPADAAPALQAGVMALLAVGPDVLVRRGAASPDLVTVTVALPRPQATQLLAAVDAGALDPFDVVGARVLDGPPPPAGPAGAATDAVDEPEPRSLQDEAWRQATAYRWSESDRAGRAVGETALREWVHRHWPTFLRARWIEHLLGERFWLELGPAGFGILRDTPEDLRPLRDELLRRLRAGADNLAIVVWARTTRSPAEKRAVLDLLCQININAHRLRCHFADD